jgi:hypothetical protein
MLILLMPLRRFSLLIDTPLIDTPLRWPTALFAATRFRFAIRRHFFGFHCAIEFSSSYFAACRFLFFIRFSIFAAIDTLRHYFHCFHAASLSYFHFRATPLRADITRWPPLRHFQPPDIFAISFFFIFFIVIERFRFVFIIIFAAAIFADAIASRHAITPLPIISPFTLYFLRYWLSFPFPILLLPLRLSLSMPIIFIALLLRHCFDTPYYFVFSMIFTPYHFHAFRLAFDIFITLR